MFFEPAPTFIEPSQFPSTVSESWVLLIDVDGDETEKPHPAEAEQGFVRDIVRWVEFMGPNPPY